MINGDMSGTDDPAGLSGGDDNTKPAQDHPPTEMVPTAKGVLQRDEQDGAKTKKRVAKCNRKKTEVTRKALAKREVRAKQAEL